MFVVDNQVRCFQIMGVYIIAKIIFVICLLVGVQGKLLYHRKIVPNCYNSDTAKFTQYWIPKQGTKDMDNNGDIITLTGKPAYRILSSNNTLIAKVDRNTYNKCEMEGTCILANGDLLNIGNTLNRFDILDPKRLPFGSGNDDNPLVPFVSVAANDIPIGTVVYVKQLDGLKLPNGMLHNGCVRVDDRGWSFGNCQLDFFVVEYIFYDILQNTLPGYIQARKEKCNILNYTTEEIFQWTGHGK